MRKICLALGLVALSTIANAGESGLASFYQGVGSGMTMVAGTESRAA